MRKLILSGAITFSLVACNQVNTSGEKTITQGEDTVSSVEISVSKTDGLIEAVETLEKADENKLIFKARGTEPGWIADFYNDKLRLVVDYGKDSIWIDDNFEGILAEKGYSYAKVMNANGKSIAISIAVNNGVPCMAASGDKEDRTVSVKFNNKEYKGCGSFFK